MKQVHMQAIKSDPAPSNILLDTAASLSCVHAQCGYHGWKFNGEGRPTFIPQVCAMNGVISLCLARAEISRCVLHGSETI